MMQGPWGFLSGILAIVLLISVIVVLVALARFLFKYGGGQRHAPLHRQGRLGIIFAKIRSRYLINCNCLQMAKMKGCVMHKLSSEIKECLEACQNCQQICLQTTLYCLEKGENHASRNHIVLLQNCADICQLSVNFMSTNSKFQSSLCNLCAEVCEQCASSCSSFGKDETMSHCADICQKCADSCRRMAQHTRAA